MDLEDYFEPMMGLHSKQRQKVKKMGMVVCRGRKVSDRTENERLDLDRHV
jgi:hypothetical protein